MDNEETLFFPLRGSEGLEVSELSARTPAVGVRCVGHTHWEIPKVEKAEALSVTAAPEGGEWVPTTSVKQGDVAFLRLPSSWRKALFPGATPLWSVWSGRVSKILKRGRPLPRMASGAAAAIGAVFGLAVATAVLAHADDRPVSPSPRPASLPPGRAPEEPFGGRQKFAENLATPPERKPPAAGRSPAVAASARIEEAFQMMGKGDCRGAARRYRELAQTALPGPAAGAINWENFARNAEAACSKDSFR